MSRSFRTAVVGVGHMGRHHARIYSELDDCELVAVVDANLERAREIAKQHGGQAFASVEDMTVEVDAVTVAVPTVHHRAVTEPLLARGVAVLVEKPIAQNYPEAMAMLECANKHEALLQIGHSERFNPLVRAMQRMNIVPKFIESHRISPFSFRSADIGVVFDMMIHDIDIVLHMAKETRYTVQAVGIPVLVREHEDIANARVMFADGCVANLTASRLALKTERTLRVFSEDAYLSMDFARKTGIAVTKDANLDILQMAREGKFEDLAQMASADFGSMVNVEPLLIDDIEPLRAELSSFLHALRTGQRPEVSGEEGVAAVKLAAEIVESLKKHDFQVSFH